MNGTNSLLIYKKNEIDRSGFLTANIGLHVLMDSSSALLAMSSNDFCEYVPAISVEYA